MAKLTWSYFEPGPGESEGRRLEGDCPPRVGPSEIDCTFDITIDKDLPPGTTVYLEIDAWDDAPAPYNQSRDVRIPIKLGARPTVSWVTPPSGGIAGGTDVLIHGSGFVAGSRIYFGTSPLIPDGGIVLDQETMTGYAPPHPAGSVAVTMQSRLGLASWDQQFQYQLPPQIQSISPSFGTQGQDTIVRVLGGNFTAATIIYVGQNLASAVPLVSASLHSPEEIDGVVPSMVGPATVWAFDANNGSTTLPYPFTWMAP